jgi:hypothetical protein
MKKWSKDLALIEGKKVMTVLPVLSEISDDVTMLQIVFTDDTEIRVSLEDTTLDWNIK